MVKYKGRALRALDFTSRCIDDVVNKEEKNM